MEIKTIEELRELPVGTVLLTHGGSVGEVRGLEDIDEDFNPIVSRAIFWTGSDIYDYLDGFTDPTDPILPATIIHTIKADDPTLAEDWFQQKFQEAKEAAYSEGHAEGLRRQYEVTAHIKYGEPSPLEKPNPYRHTP